MKPWSEDTRHTEGCGLEDKREDVMVSKTVTREWYWNQPRFLVILWASHSKLAFEFKKRLVILINSNPDPMLKVSTLTQGVQDWLSKNFVPQSQNRIMLLHCVSHTPKMAIREASWEQKAFQFRVRLSQPRWAGLPGLLNLSFWIILHRATSAFCLCPTESWAS